MKTKELISKLNDMPDIESFTRGSGIYIYNLEGKTIGWTFTNEFGLVDTSYIDLIDTKNKEEVVNLLFEYALTPLDEREDELKFRVKMLPEDDDDWEIYLNLNKSDNHIFIDDSVNGIPDNQTIFTKSEYDNLQQKCPMWLPKFDEKDPHFEFLEEK